ncbi:MAG: cupin domain-containing protein [Deltaproteobacteria bacterium]|nr:cupin domain-containing protein [Deltaproteobacteria bacterium]
MFKPVRIGKPWGFELIWAHTEKYVGKILHIDAGQKLSLQFHNIKDETIHLLSGRMNFEIEENGVMVVRTLRPGDSYHIPPKSKHRMEAEETCDVLEASTPHLDDVVRLQDAYGRVEAEIKNGRK